MQGRAVQGQFDFTRASKLRTMERIGCSGPVKAILKALDGFARDKAKCIETMHAIATSMGVSESTARRYIKEAKAMGVLEVTGDPTDGCSNEYRIKWEVVFSLPDRMATPRRRRKDSTPGGPPARTPEIAPETPVKIAPPTPSKLEGDPCQDERGPLSSWKGTPVMLTGVSRTDSYDSITASVRQQKIYVGGVGLIVKDPEGSATKRSGWWAGHIGDLSNPTERDRLHKAAMAAGLLSDSNVDRVRVTALAMQSSSRPAAFARGFFVKHVEWGDWSWLDPKYVKTAMDRLLAANGLRLTREEFERVRVNEPRGSAE